MTFVTLELKEGVQKLFEKLSSPDYPPAGPTSVDTRLIGPQTSEAKWPNFTVISDEPKSIGGRDSAPAPSSLFVASIGFAENVIFARQAAMHGLDFESLETRVEAQWDRRGIFGISQANPSVTDVFIQTKVTTSASPEKVAELVKLTDKRSPITTTIAKAATIRRKLLVNEKEVPL